MTQSRRWTWLSAACILLAALSGCGGSAASTQNPSNPSGGARSEGPDRSKIDPMDPCAAALQDLCPMLQLYYKQMGRLPERLEELQQVDPGLKMACPVSGKPYVYHPDGLRAPGMPGLFVVYDAEPVHAGWRLGVVIQEPHAGRPLVAYVQPLPEAALRGQSR